MRKVIFVIFMFVQLFSDEMRKCTKEDLIGGTWIVSHSKLFDKTADQTRGSYVSHFLRPLQLLRYMENGELRSVYSETKPEDDKFEFNVKLLSYSQGEKFEIDENGIISIKSINGNMVDQMICKYYTVSIPQVDIAKGSVYLLRYAGDKPLVGVIYQRIPNEIIENIEKNNNVSNKK